MTRAEAKYLTKMYRAYNKRNSLAPYMFKGLDERGFIWENKIDYQWKQNYNKLIQFKKETGHTIVPPGSGKLVAWCKRQRWWFADGKLSEDRIKLLEDIGFSWNLTEDKWKQSYDEMAQYKQKNGHCDVPNKNGKLGRWCSTQRGLYKNKHKRMTKDRIKLLNNLGFKWKIK